MKPSIFFRHLLSFLFGAGVILAFLMASIDLGALHKGFYHDFYDEIQIDVLENIRMVDAKNGIDLMLDYVNGERDDLNGTIIWKNGEQPAFNEKEISHMKDVKNLWIHSRNVGILGAVLAVSCALGLWLLSRKHWISWLCKGFLMAGTCLLVLLVFFGFWMWIDFTGLWVQFHHWFFTNDLWSLDPFTDFMIVICPESLFFSLIIRICLFFAVPLLLMTAFSIYYLKKKAVIGFEKEKQS